MLYIQYVRTLQIFVQLFRYNLLINPTIHITIATELKKHIIPRFLIPTYPLLRTAACNNCLLAAAAYSGGQ